MALQYTRLSLLASLIIAVGCWGCTDSLDKSESPPPPAAKPTIEQLLDLYSPISLDTLVVTSDDEEENDAFQGHLIDTSFFYLFPENVDQMMDNQGFFACYQFQIEDQVIGLITRTPSEYTSSSIKLWTFHQKKNKITYVTELAESWGDAGDVFIKSSLLFRTKKDIHWLEFRSDCSYELDSLEKETQACSDSYTVYRLKHNRPSKVQEDSALLAIYQKRLHQ